MLSITSSPVKALSGTAIVPADKSISHRSVIFGALADGVTEVTNLLTGEDVLSTVAAFRSMGVLIEGPDSGQLRISGAGKVGLQAPGDELDLGNSGTSMRLLSGLLSGQRFHSRLTGDESLRRRPMGRVVDPLTAMGAVIQSCEGCPPLDIQPSQGLTGIKYQMPVASAQVKSALLLAGLYAEGETLISETTPTRDHTERMLAGFSKGQWQAGSAIRINGDIALTGQCLEVPGDISSAAFLLVAATICPGSDLLLPGVGINPTRSAVLAILRLMGANIEISSERLESNEPVCDLRVRSASLKGIDIPPEFVANAIDEFPVLAIAAAAASGVTRVRGARELRVKESDRIAAVVQGLATLGIDAVEYPDGMDITGGAFGSGSIESFGDHRIAMAFAVAGCMSEGSVEIRDAGNIRTSFPNFLSLANSIGMNISELPG
ncbi:MAG: 3-phosphoshikimate 1-carboxyvinyltransferase [Arenicellales bacterium]